jgi:hypothetical protein
MNVTRYFPGVVARGYVGNSPNVDNLPTSERLVSLPSSFDYGKANCTHYLRRMDA